MLLSLQAENSKHWPWEKHELSISHPSVRLHLAFLRYLRASWGQRLRSAPFSPTVEGLMYCSI